MRSGLTGRDLFYCFSPGIRPGAREHFWSRCIDEHNGSRDCPWVARLRVHDFLLCSDSHPSAHDQQKQMARARTQTPRRMATSLNRQLTTMRQM